MSSGVGGEGGKLDLENVKISGEAQAFAGANENDYHWGGVAGNDSHLRIVLIYTTT